MKSRLLPPVIIAAVTCSSLAAGLEVTLEKITEVTSPVNLGDPVVVGGTTFYYGVSGSAANGLYRNGSLVVGPGGSISDSEVGSAGVSGGDSSSVLVGATSNYAAPTPDNFYSTLNVIAGGGSPVRILSRNTTFPGYPAPPHPGNPIGPGTIHAGQVAFLIREYAFTPRLPSAVAVTSSGGGTVTVIAKDGDPVPNGGGTFSVFDGATYPYVHNGSVIFTGRSLSRRGIYEWTGGSLSVVVDQTMAKPEGGTFTGATFGFEPVKSEPDYAFIANSALYRKRDGQFTLVANSVTPVPGGTGNLTTYTAPSFSNGRLVFLGSRGTAEYGIYLNIDGTITPIVDKRTDFGTPGKTPVAYGLARSGAWAGDHAIGFRVTFSDNSTAIYKATFQPTDGKMDAHVVFTGPRTGTISVTSRTGYTYKLFRTLSLAGDDEELVSKAGTGGSLVFPFDDSTYTGAKAFFRVRETKD